MFLSKDRGGFFFPLFLFLFFSFFSLVQANDSTNSLKKNLNYVHWLIQQGDYYRAIGELRKIQWYSPREKWLEIEFEILHLYQLSGHIEEGLKEWETFSKLHPELISSHSKWWLAKAQLLLSINQFRDVYPLLSTISTIPEGEKIAKLLQERKKILLSPSPDDRSPLTAGIMSAVIPGAGEWYAGLPGNGVFTFIVVSLFGAGSYYLYKTSSPAFYIVFPLTLLFYSGNIYGAVTSTYRMNLIRRQQKWNYLKTSNNWDLLLQIKF